MNLKYVVFLLGFTLLSFNNVNAQLKGSTPEEKQRAADEKKEQLKEEELRAQEEGKERHESLQDKKTRKRMKKNKKRAQRNNDNKGKPWYEKTGEKLENFWNTKILRKQKNRKK